MKTPPTRREQEREARIAWILKNAMELVMDEGLEGLTTPALAQKLDYTVGAMYRYFPSKEALVAALHVHTAEFFYSAFFTSLEHTMARYENGVGKKADEKTTALFRLLTLFAIYRELADAYPVHFQMIAVLLSRDPSWLSPEDQQKVSTTVLPRLAQLLTYFQHAEKTGALSKGDTPTRLMTAWTSLHGVLGAARLHRQHPQLVNPQAMFRELMTGLTTAWGADEKALAAAQFQLNKLLQEGPLLDHVDLPQHPDLLETHPTPAAPRRKRRTS